MPRKKSALSAEMPTKTVLQFKISLKHSRPAIWRRIQFADCTLNKLHHYIQTAMGWSNSHLHEFDIKGQRYGDPHLLLEIFEEHDYKNSLTTLVSKLLQNREKGFAFLYTYDFGDTWEHEVKFEGSIPANPDSKYPLCVKGAMACPPEDCGGLWGYESMLEAIADPEHKEHEDMLEWLGGPFDPTEFQAEEATRFMQELRD